MKEVWNEIMEGIGPRAFAFSLIFLALMLLAAFICAVYLNESISSHIENIHNLNFETS